MADMTILSLFWHASLVVKAVMLFLFVTSIVSWMFIFQQHLLLNRTKNKLKSFLTEFNNNPDFLALYNNLGARQKSLDDIKVMFMMGLSEFLSLQRHIPEQTTDILNGTKAVMQLELKKIISKLDKHLSVLATIQSMSPYIGLFGTVWGIMHSFGELGKVQQATLSMVAPGISEALIATAMGLIAAIPAGIFYNKFINKESKIAEDLEIFIERFIMLLHKRIRITEEQMYMEDTV